MGAMHGGHSHAHDHAHGPAHGLPHQHSHPTPGTGRRYTVAIALNLAFVAVETVAGFLANSTALLSDAAHNLSDVLGLALAGVASWLASRSAGAQRTYGYSKATVLAALANGLILVFACGALLWEAIVRLLSPQESAPLIMMAVAAVGVVVNGATALLFAAGSRHDVNMRGAFLHMAADAGVSAAVIVAGAAIWATNLAWVDPAVSICVVVIILWGAWGLLKESLDLTLDAAPAHIDVAAVRDYLAGQPGVTAVHDLHVWAMSASAPALTAHLVRPEGHDDAFLAELSEGIARQFGIRHVTVQVERARRDDCAEC